MEVEEMIERTSTPFNRGLNSGQMNALPAYAASMCIQMFSSLPGKDRKQKWTAGKPSHPKSVNTKSTWAIWVSVPGVGGG